MIYARFSPRRNADDSESIETQMDLCRAYCARQGYAVKAVHEDRAISGADEDRPGLWAALDDLDRGDVLVVYKPDRLARDVYLAEVIHRAVARKEAKVEAVEGGANGGTPEQVMIRQVLQAFAEYERKVCAARTSAAMRRHQETGRRMSRYPPWGWMLDPSDPKRMLRNPHEEQVRQRILAEREAGMSFAEIASGLDMAGITYRGKRWTWKSIRRVIARGEL